MELFWKDFGTVSVPDVLSTADSPVIRGTILTFYALRQFNVALSFEELSGIFTQVFGSGMLTEESFVRLLYYAALLMDDVVNQSQKLGVLADLLDGRMISVKAFTKVSLKILSGCCTNIFRHLYNAQFLSP